MKTLLAALLCLTCHAGAIGATQESLCLTVGDYAATVATSRAYGMSEKELTDGITDPVIRGRATDIIRFVYMMELKPVEARRTVYLKCLTSGFGIKQ